MKEQQQVIDKFDRGVLGEGRNFGLGYSILKKIDSDTYETLMPFTACKDYLNDFIYIESTTNPLERVYGFEHKYTGELKDKEYFYLGLKALHYNKSTTKYEFFDKVEKIIKDNYTNIIKSLNKLESLFDTKNFSEFEAYIDTTLIIKVPILWSKFSFLFSMYGLFIRCFLDVTEEEANLDTNKLVEDKKETLIAQDTIMLQPMKKFFIKTDINKLLNYVYPDNVKGYTIHSYGINGRLAVVNG